MTRSMRIVDGERALGALPVVQSIYDEVFVEAPYCEGPEDFADFAAMWPRRVAQPGFRLVLVSEGGESVGMAFGRPLPADTTWWAGLLVNAAKELTAEWAGRSFGINEIAVRARWRRQGVARWLHDELLAGTGVERAVLLVRPEAEPAQKAYAGWGYETIGPIVPFEGAPVYDAMVLPLRDLPPAD